MVIAERPGRGLAENNVERGIDYGINFFCGYVQEQLYTTLNLLPFDIARKHIPIEREPESLEESLEEARIKDSSYAGAILGVAQDAASLALSVNYLCGNDSKLAHIATGVVATKLVLNVLSLAAQGIYLRVGKNSNPNLELCAD